VSVHPSRYNFSVSHNGGAALYNARTGALLQLDGADTLSLTSHLCKPDFKVEENAFSAEFFRQLVAGGFVVDSTFDELMAVREAYWKARGETPFVLTITTTMECNLGCYYCYETRSGAALSTGQLDDVLRAAREGISRSPFRSLHVDWYGGEPLLNISFIETASLALQCQCDEMGVSYVASIISNGTEWPPDIESFVRVHHIRQVQISFDGLKRNHDKRRKYLKGLRALNHSSFDKAVATVDRLVKVAHVDVRLNLDRGNASDLIPFVEFGRSHGWFDGPRPASFQPARLASYSERSSFLRNYELSQEEFDSLRAIAREQFSGSRNVQESEIPDGYPYPKTSVCAALGNASRVIGADGLTYRCGLQVGERRRAVGSLAQMVTTVESKSYPDAPWWERFDPTKQANCSRCSFLPICWGGCPKKHLEGDIHAIQEQGKYWRSNLPRLIAQRAGIETPSPSSFSEALQFRESGRPPETVVSKAEAVKHFITASKPS
jgi:uncharacterized protein